MIYLRTFPLFLVLLTPFFMASQCTSQRTLDPEGAYAGDRLLFEFDGVIVETTKTFQEVVALADRNAAFVASKPDLAEKVAKIRAEVDGVPVATETLVRLHTARDAYLAARDTVSAGNLRREIATAQTLLETARAVLPLFVQP